MAIDADSVFRLLREAHASGLLEKLLAIAGDALDSLIEETGLGTADLLVLLDGVSRERVLAAEDRVAASDPADVLKSLERLAREPEQASANLRQSLARAVASAQGEV